MRVQRKEIKTFPLVGVALAWLVSTALVHTSHGQALIHAVDAVGMTVANMDRSLAFYTQVLSFTPVSDVEVTGSEYEHLQGVFGLRMRVVRLRLGDEAIVLTEYLAPRGRPIPVDSRSNDRWFQHIAIIVSDMERAYGWLRQHKVEHASSGPQRLPEWNTRAAGIQAFYFKVTGCGFSAAHELVIVATGEGNSSTREWCGQKNAEDSGAQAGTKCR